MRVIYAAEQILIVTKQQTRTNNTNSNIKKQKHRMKKKQTNTTEQRHRNEPKRKKTKKIWHIFIVIKIIMTIEGTNSPSIRRDYECKQANN